MNGTYWNVQSAFSWINKRSEKRQQRGENSSINNNQLDIQQTKRPRPMQLLYTNRKTRIESNHSNCYIWTVVHFSTEHLETEWKMLSLLLLHIFSICSYLCTLSLFHYLCSFSPLFISIQRPCKHTHTLKRVVSGGGEVVSLIRTWGGEGVAEWTNCKCRTN